MRSTLHPIRWIVLLAALAALALLAAACGDDNDVDDVDVDDDVDVTIGLSISTLDNPFFVDLADGAEDTADAEGVSISVADSQNDAETEAANIDDFITQGVDVIIINPVDSDAAVAAVENANDAGIPVVSVDRGVEGGDIASHIASDNVLGGEMAAEHLFELLDGEGLVAQLEGVPGASAAVERGEGFDNALGEAEGIDLATSVSADFDRAEGFSVAQDVFTAEPDLDGLFAQNDEMALGAIEAAEAAGILDDLVIVGFDATDDGVAAVQDGRMDATIAQLPIDMGMIAVQQAVAIAAGDDVDAEIPVEVALVTPDNVDEFAE